MFNCVEVSAVCVLFEVAAVQALRAAMPPVMRIESDPHTLYGATRGLPEPLCQWPLPPLIVTEKGESLDEFAARSAPDFFTSLQVRCRCRCSCPLQAFSVGACMCVMRGRCVQVMMHVMHKLEGLHEAGWVHRDLKPGNAIWLPSSNSWTLIDFGSAARTGAPPPPCQIIALGPANLSPVP